MIITPLRIPPKQPALLLDDSAVDRMIAQKVIERSRLSNPVLLFETADELFAHLDDVEVGSAPFPAVILIDINMPGLDGHEVLAAVRARPGFEELPVVVMLTSSAASSDRTRALDGGADGYVIKAVGIAEYVAEIERHLTN